jgi:amidase
MLNVPFRTAATTPPTRSLKFGLLTTSPTNPTHPPILRALERTASLLEEKGHTVVRLDDSLPPLDESSLLAFKFFSLDPDATPFTYLRAANEPPVPSLSICTLPALHDWKPSVTDLWDMTRARTQFRAAWHALLARDGGLDALILPGYQATAPKHDSYRIPQWTVVANLLDYPAGILPFGFADEELDAPFFKDNAAYEPAYDPKAVQGSPAHIQLMGKPLMDEELLGVMCLVEGILKEAKAQ